MAELTDYERKNCTESTQRLILAVREMGDEALLDMAREGETWHALRELYPSVNPYWLTAQAATEAYERGVMEPEEMDRILD
jgi:hypothetical protein